MVFESVEISTPTQEDVAVSWPAIAAGAIAAAALTLVLLAFGAGMGFSAVSPWGNSGISASTFQITTGLYLIVVALLASAMGGICRRAIAYKMGRCPYPRSLLPRYSSWLFGVGIGHCDRRRVLGRGGQQHCWRRITGTCSGTQCVGNCGLRQPFGLLCGCLVATQSCRKPECYRSGSSSPRNCGHPDEGRC